jgi:hypothetical protein
LAGLAHKTKPEDTSRLPAKKVQIDMKTFEKVICQQSTYRWDISFTSKLGQKWTSGVCNLNRSGFSGPVPVMLSEPET